MKMCFPHRFIFMQINSFSCQWLERDSFWNRGTRELGNRILLSWKQSYCQTVMFFFTLFNMAKTKRAGSLERLLFSYDNDCEQKMFQQAEPVNKRCLHRLKSGKKKYFLLESAVSPRRDYFDYWVITFFSPWLFLRIKKIFGDTFLPTIYEKL